MALALDFDDSGELFLALALDFDFDRSGVFVLVFVLDFDRSGVFVLALALDFDGSGEFVFGIVLSRLLLLALVAKPLLGRLSVVVGFELLGLPVDFWLSGGNSAFAASTSFVAAKSLVVVGVVDGITFFGLVSAALNFNSLASVLWFGLSDTFWVF